MRSLGGTAALILILSSCSSAQPTSKSLPSVARTAPMIVSLPDGCGTPTSDTGSVAFMKSGRVWAFDAITRRLDCLFEHSGSPGPFAWGPRADRVLLSSFEVRRVTGEPLENPAEEQTLSWFAWGRPQGKSIVFVPPDAKSIKKTTFGSGVIDITPTPGVSFGDVAYHPSGRAIAFATYSVQESAIWISSNEGNDPQRLLFSHPETRFLSLDFVSGETLSYAANHHDGKNEIHYFDLASGPSEMPWESIERRFLSGSANGFATTGGGCRDSTVVDLENLDPVLDGLAQPTALIGDLGGAVLVRAGDCEGPFDLWLVKRDGEPELLVEEADAGGIREADPSPAPELPAIGSIPIEGFA